MNPHGRGRAGRNAHCPGSPTCNLRTVFGCSLCFGYLTTNSTQNRRGGAEPNRRLVRTGLFTAVVYLATLLFYVRGFQGYTRTAREVFIWLAVLPLLYLFWRGYRLVRDSAGEIKTSQVVWF